MLSISGKRKIRAVYTIGARDGGVGCILALRRHCGVGGFRDVGEGECER